MYIKRLIVNAEKKSVRKKKTAPRLPVHIIYYILSVRDAYNSLTIYNRDIQLIVLTHSAAASTLNVDLIPKIFFIFPSAIAEHCPKGSNYRADWRLLDV